MASCKADIYFLADNTGSMGGAIDDAQEAAGDVLVALQSLPNLDLAFGVGKYNDLPAIPSAFFTHQQDITPDSNLVIAAIDDWSAGGGGDTPESWLLALDQLAVPADGVYGWRPGSFRVIVQLGDAPSHDPICPGISGLPYEITEVSVTEKLIAQGIVLGAISVGDPGLNDDGFSGDYQTACGPSLINAGQSSRISHATGGILTNVESTNLAELFVNLILAITENCDNLRRRTRAQLVGAG